MEQLVNHFVRVDEVWSYNMIGGLKGIDNINMAVLQDIFDKLAAFMTAKHQFHTSKNAQQYNGFMHVFREHFDTYEVGANYFMNYFEMLFRMISPALAQVPGQIRSCQTMVNDNCEVIGFVFGV